MHAPTSHFPLFMLRNLFCIFCIITGPDSEERQHWRWSSCEYSGEEDKREHQMSNWCILLWEWPNCRVPWRWPCMRWVYGSLHSKRDIEWKALYQMSWCQGPERIASVSKGNTISCGRCCVWFNQTGWESTLFSNSVLLWKYFMFSWLWHIRNGRIGSFGWIQMHWEWKSVQMQPVVATLCEWIRWWGCSVLIAKMASSAGYVWTNGKAMDICIAVMQTVPRRQWLSCSSRSRGMRGQITESWLAGTRTFHYKEFAQIRDVRWWMNTVTNVSTSRARNALTNIATFASRNGVVVNADIVNTLGTVLLFAADTMMNATWRDCKRNGESNLYSTIKVDMR